MQLNLSLSSLNFKLTVVIIVLLITALIIYTIKNNRSNLDDTTLSSSYYFLGSYILLFGVILLGIIYKLLIPLKSGNYSHTSETKDLNALYLADNLPKPVDLTSTTGPTGDLDSPKIYFT